MYMLPRLSTAIISSHTIDGLHKKYSLAGSIFYVMERMKGITHMLLCFISLSQVAHLPGYGVSYSRLAPLATRQPTGLPRLRQRPFGSDSPRRQVLLQ